MADAAEDILSEPAVSAGGGPEPSGPLKPRESLVRLVSLDAFRGLAVLGMLLVNNKALGPWTPAHLTHAGWNAGIHLADLVYPWFVLIVGVAIPFSTRGRAGPRLARVRRAIKRAALLVLLGCLVNSSYARHPLFDLGVLQLIGVAYLGGALLYWLPLAPRMTVAGLLLLGHWAALRFLPIPGVGAGVFTQSQNVVSYLNHTYLGRWELENLPVVLPTVALVLIGTAIGDLLRQSEVTPTRKLRLVLVTGLVLMAAGWLWSLDLPFNKRVWTPPYVLFAAGWGLVALAAFHFVMDVRLRRAWAFPLVVMGRNPLTAFVLPILVNIYVLSGWGRALPNGSFVSLQQSWVQFFTRHAGAGPGGLLYTLSYLLAWWLVLLYLDRKRIYLRV